MKPIRHELNRYDVTVLLGRQVTAMREAKGWSVPELASRAGLSEDKMFLLEQGDLDCEMATLTRLASVFDVALISHLASWPEWLGQSRDVPASFAEEFKHD